MLSIRSFLHLLSSIDSSSRSFGIDSVGEVKLAEEGESEKAVDFNRLSEFHHDGRVEVIAWSPESSLLTFPKVGTRSWMS